MKKDQQTKNCPDLVLIGGGVTDSMTEYRELRKKFKELQQLIPYFVIVLTIGKFLIP